MGNTPEGRVKAKVKKLLAPHVKSGVVWYFCPTTRGFGGSGVPDFIGSIAIDSNYRNGRPFAIETKATSKDHPTRLQSLAHEMMVLAGCSVVVVRGLDDSDPGWCRLVNMVERQDFSV